MKSKEYKFKRYIVEITEDGKRFCKRCNNFKPLSDFYKSGYLCLDGSKTHKYKAVCVQCDKVRVNKRRDNPRGRALSLCSQSLNRARKHNWEHSISPSDIERVLLTGHCQVTGIPFDFRVNLGYEQKWLPWAPSLDRIDSKKGYTKDNVQVVVWMYNIAKSTWAREDVLTMAKALVASEPS